MFTTQFTEALVNSINASTLGPANLHLEYAQIPGVHQAAMKVIYNEMMHYYRNRDQDFLQALDRHIRSVATDGRYNLEPILVQALNHAIALQARVNAIKEEAKDPNRFYTIYDLEGALAAIETKKNAVAQLAANPQRAAPAAGVYFGGYQQRPALQAYVPAPAIDQNAYFGFARAAAAPAAVRQPRPANAGPVKAIVAPHPAANFAPLLVGARADAKRDHLALIDDDFEKGAWWAQIEADFAKAKANNDLGTAAKSWEELYNILKSLWFEPTRSQHVNNIAEMWREPYKRRNMYSFGTVPYHTENHCPGTADFNVSASHEDKLKYPAGYDDFENPNQEYLIPLLTNIKSLHKDLYNAYQWAKSTNDALILNNLFASLDGYHICVEAKVKALQAFHLRADKGLPFFKIVESIFNDYTRQVCLIHDWELMPHDELLKKEDGKYFYIEDIVEYGTAYHANLKSSDGKTIADLEQFLDDLGIYDRRPALYEKNRFI